MAAPVASGLRACRPHSALLGRESLIVSLAPLPISDHNCRALRTRRMQVVTQVSIKARTWLLIVSHCLALDPGVGWRAPRPSGIVTSVPSSWRYSRKSASSPEPFAARVQGTNAALDRDHEMAMLRAERPCVFTLNVCGANDVQSLPLRLTHQEITTGGEEKGAG